MNTSADAGRVQSTSSTWGLTAAQAELVEQVAHLSAQSFATRAAKHDAEAKGYQDALMLDYRGRIAEATGANIFLIQDGKIHTPIPDCFLNGITRQTVIELAKRRGYEVIERAIMPEELAKTQEVFITGTAAEVTPVGQIDDYHFTPGEITKQMIEDYDAEVHGRSPSAASAA